MALIDLPHDRSNRREKRVALRLKGGDRKLKRVSLLKHLSGSVCTEFTMIRITTSCGGSIIKRERSIQNIAASLCLGGNSELHDGGDDVSLGAAESLNGLLAGALTLGHDEIDILGGELGGLSRGGRGGGGGGRLLNEGGCLLSKSSSSSSSSRSHAGSGSSLSQGVVSLVNLRLSEDHVDLTRGRLEHVGLRDGEDGLTRANTENSMRSNINVHPDRQKGFFEERQW